MSRMAALALASLLLACSTGTPPATSTLAPTAASTATPTAPPPTPTPTPAASIAPTTLPDGVLPGGNSWGASAGAYLTNAGDRALFICPPDGSEYSIWGTDVYTGDLSVCTAGVHSEMVTFEGGGQLIAELRPGEQSYVGTTRNGVTSRDYTSYASSFVLVGAQVPPPPTSGPAGSIGPLSPAATALLPHIPQHMLGDCMEVSSFDAGVLASIQCINVAAFEGYVVYKSFDNSSNLADSFFGNLDFFGEGIDDELDNCAIGPSLIAWERDGIAEGRRFCNNYESAEPGALISFWFDDGLLIEATLVVYDGTFAEIDLLALSAGPNP